MGRLEREGRDGGIREGSASVQDVNKEHINLCLDLLSKLLEAQR